MFCLVNANDVIIMLSFMILYQLSDEIQDEESVKQLSDADLLKRHVDRAKKVRAR